MAYLLVGEGPLPAEVGRPASWLLPDESDSARHLARIAGYSHEEFCQVFAYRTHLWPYPKRHWTMSGRQNALAIKRQYEGEVDGVVLLGPKVAECFDVTGWLTWSSVWTHPIAACPHPKGRACGYWNEHKDEARAFFEGLRT